MGIVINFFEKWFKKIECNCLSKNDQNIKYGSYIRNDVLFEKLKQKYKNISFENLDGSYVDFKYKEGEYSFRILGNYYEKACLSCETCLTDLTSLYDSFEYKISEIDDELKVSQICKEKK